MPPVAGAVAAARRAAASLVAAHSEVIHLTYQVQIPAHLPRAQDPHYALFNRARARMEKAGLLKCQHCGAPDTPDAPTELHHTLVEFCLVAAIDPAKFAHAHPELFPDLDPHGAGVTDEAFAAAIEGPGNLTPLCKRCHTGEEGIHRLPFPMWEVLPWLLDPSHPVAVALAAKRGAGVE